MIDAAGPAFLETKACLRYQKFCVSCCRYRYIGLCYTHAVRDFLAKW